MINKKKKQRKRKKRRCVKKSGERENERGGYEDYGVETESQRMNERNTHANAITSH